MRNRACCCYGPCDKFGSVGAEGEERVVAGDGETITVVSANACTDEVLESGDLGCVLSHPWVNADDDEDGVDNACDPCRDYKGTDPDYPNDSDKDSVWDCEDKLPASAGSRHGQPPEPPSQASSPTSTAMGSVMRATRISMVTASSTPTTTARRSRTRTKKTSTPKNGLGDLCDPRPTQMSTATGCSTWRTAPLKTPPIRRSFVRLKPSVATTAAVAPAVRGAKVSLGAL